MWNFKLLCLFLTFFSYGQCYNFLGIFPMPIASHMKIFATLMKELARKGHNVTVVSTFPDTNFLPNYKNIDLSDYLPNFIEVVDLNDLDPDSVLFRYMGPTAISSWADTVCEGLASAPIQNLLRGNETFDAIIIEQFNSDCYLGIANKIEAPLIGFSSSGILPWMNRRYGNPTNPAYIPDIFLDLSDKMGFLDRVGNTLTVFTHNLFYEHYRFVKDKEFVKKYVGEDVTDLESLVKRFSLFIVNTHFTMNLPVPLAPNVIQVGGIHIQEPKALPKHLKQWIEDSVNGIIYFSMGSMTKGLSLPKEKMNAFLNAFELLPHRVVWKWENETMDGKTEKVLTQKWIPQLDLLCHPNVKLFISHGGHLGLTEAVHCNVPVLIMPQYGDQNTNARALEAAGGGVVLRISDVTEETVFKTILKTLNLRDNMTALSKRFKDRPLPPLENAVYWTEYVVRQNGASFIKTAAVDMPLYQYYLLDVLLFIVSILVVVLYAVSFVIKSIYMLCLVRKYKHKSE